MSDSGKAHTASELAERRKKCPPHYWPSGSDDVQCSKCGMLWVDTLRKAEQGAPPAEDEAPLDAIDYAAIIERWRRRCLAAEEELRHACACRWGRDDAGARSEYDGPQEPVAECGYHLGTHEALINGDAADERYRELAEAAKPCVALERSGEHVGWSIAFDTLAAVLRKHKEESP